MEFHHVGQAGLELVISRDPSASRSAGIIGIFWPTSVLLAGIRAVGRVGGLVERVLLDCAVVIHLHLELALQVGGVSVDADAHWAPEVRGD
ncbi:hypothetical protein AAY473_040551 [Plecturocebus cupreus]